MACRRHVIPPALAFAVQANLKFVAFAFDRGDRRPNQLARVARAAAHRGDAKVQAPRVGVVREFGDGDVRLASEPLHQTARNLTPVLEGLRPGYADADLCGEDGGPQLRGTSSIVKNSSLSPSRTSWNFSRPAPHS